MKFFQSKITDLQEIIDFNEKHFYYGTYSEEYIKYRFIDNPFCEFPLDTIYFVKDDSKTNNYVGQMMTMPEKLVYKGGITTVYWGIDYIVDENYRGSGIGKELTNYFLSKDYYIAVGFSPKSEVIHKKMGCKAIGYLNYYYHPLSYSNYLKFLFHRAFKLKNKDMKAYHFSDQISVNNIKFKRIVSEKDFINPELQWNRDIVEGIRNKEFVKWRFLYKPDRYFIYQADNHEIDKNPAYFVAKPNFWKGVNCLMIADMRYDIENQEEFISILKAAKILAKQLNLFAVLIASSISNSNKILEKRGYKLLAEKVVLTKYPFDFKEAESHSNNKLMLGYADSDLDFFTGKGKFIYGKDY